MNQEQRLKLEQIQTDKNKHTDYWDLDVRVCSLFFLFKVELVYSMVRLYDIYKRIST